MRLTAHLPLLFLASVARVLKEAADDAVQCLDYLAGCMPPVPTGKQLLATILKHDSKTTSYKFALLRTLNDVVLGHPDLALAGELDTG